MLQVAQFNADKYGALPGIEEAHTALAAHGGLAAIDRILACVEFWNLEAIVGVAVLHNHYSVSRDGAPLQRKEFIQGAALLITEEAAINSAEAAPHIMKLEGDTENPVILPLEFSYDPAVRDAHERLTAAAGFWEDVAGVIFAEGVEHQLGLAIVARSGVPTKDIVWIETTHSGEGGRLRNVLRAVSASDADLSGAIQTIYVSQKVDAACNGSCSPSGSYCLPYGTHHQKQVNHDRRHSSF